jgi:hypothetical protein
LPNASVNTIWMRHHGGANPRVGRPVSDHRRRCCGTTPPDIAAMSNLSRTAAAKLPSCHLSPSPALSRCHRRRQLFVNVGERTNIQLREVQASDQREKVQRSAGRYRQQVESGAQIIDINMDEGMLDAEAAMVRFLNLIAGEPDIARVTIMIDSPNGRSSKRG